MTWRGQTVYTRKQAAEQADVEAWALTNYARHKAIYQEGKNFFRLTGDELQEFFLEYPMGLGRQSLYLWTEKGVQILLREKEKISCGTGRKCTTFNRRQRLQI